MTSGWPTGCSTKKKAPFNLEICVSCSWFIHQPIAQIMARIPRTQRLASLGATALSPTSIPRAQFAATRALSSTPRLRGTETTRQKLWRGKPPGADDPYTQRPEEAAPESNIPREARDGPVRSEGRRPAGVRRSRLKLPPKQSEAATEAEVKAADPTYAPAQSVAELASLPSLNDWWHQPGHWGAESQFKGFGGANVRKKITGKNLVEVQLRRALVEVLALQQAGSLEQFGFKRWADGGREALESAMQVTLEVEDGKPVLKGDGAAVVEGLMPKDGDAEGAVENHTIRAEQAEALIEGWNPAWKDAVLTDESKFLVCVTPQTSMYAG